MTKTIKSEKLTDTAPNEWLSPISKQEPCGPSLEYDTEYAVLDARMAPQADVQYGEFINKPETPDWGEIERDSLY